MSSGRFRTPSFPRWGRREREAPGAEEREELPPEEDVGEDRSYSPFEPID